MSIAITCSACRYSFAVPDEFAGKKGKCPKCGAVNVAPALGPAPSPAPAPARAAAPPVKAKPAATPAPAPAAPAPRPAPAPARAVATPVSAPKPATASSSAFDFGPTEKPSPAKPSSSVASRTPTSAKKAKKSPVMVLAGAGGGALALGVIVVVAYLAFASGETKPIAVAATKTVTKKPKKEDEPFTKKARPVAEESSGLLDRQRGTSKIETAKAVQASSLEEVRLGVVKIETPNVSLGSGFIINDKGWIATNHHVIEGATNHTRIRMENGQTYAVAGLIADLPERDMAIIKLAEVPFQMTVLDISYNKQPPQGSKVIAVGHPRDAEFTVTGGIVGRVVTSTQLDGKSQAWVRGVMRAADDQIWIQHDAKISPGNSGGPLLDENYRVIGINTWVNQELGFGFAGHIDHLRALAETASDTPKPFTKTGNVYEVAEEDQLYNIVPTAARIDLLTSHCSKFNWKPTSLEEYDAMAELAKLVTLVLRTSRASRDLKDAAIRSSQTIGQLPWSAEQIAAINKFASDSVDKPLHGAFFIATVIDAAEEGGQGIKLDQLQLEGSNRYVVVPRGGKALGAKGARVLVMGWNTEDVLPSPVASAAQRIIMHGYAVELKQ